MIVVENKNKKLFCNIFQRDSTVWEEDYDY